MIDVNAMKLPNSYVVSEHVMSKLNELLSLSSPLEEANSIVLSNTATSSSLLHLRGLGKEIWEGIDAQDYIDKLRSEWE